MGVHIFFAFFKLIFDNTLKIIVIITIKQLIATSDLNTGWQFVTVKFVLPISKKIKYDTQNEMMQENILQKIYFFMESPKGFTIVAICIYTDNPDQPTEPLITASFNENFFIKEFAVFTAPTISKKADVMHCVSTDFENILIKVFITENTTIYPHIFKIVIVLLHTISVNDIFSYFKLFCRLR